MSSPFHSILDYFANKTSLRSTSSPRACIHFSPLSLHWLFLECTRVLHCCCLGSALIPLNHMAVRLFFCRLRHHERDTCYQAGYVLRGEISLYRHLAGRCIKGPPKIREWVFVSLEVRGVVAHVSIAYTVGDTAVDTSYRTRHIPRGRVGTMAMAGYDTVLWYKTETLKKATFSEGRRNILPELVSDLATSHRRPPFCDYKL